MKLTIHYKNGSITTVKVPILAVSKTAKGWALVIYQETIYLHETEGFSVNE